MRRPLARFLAPALTAAIAITLSACEQGAGTGSDVTSEMLALVPADTPYLFVSDHKLPAPLSERIYKSIAAQLEQPPELPPRTADNAKTIDLALAIREELKGHMTPEGLRSLGIEPNGRMLGYGLGILPVLRIQTSDPRKAEDFLARIEKRAGVAAEQRTQGKVHYRRIALDPLSLVLALHDGYLIAALLPNSQEQALLPLVLGDVHPNETVDPARFAAFREQHGFEEHGAGYLDWLRLFDLMRGKAGTEVGARVMRALNELKPLPRTSPACERLYRGLIEAAPTLSAGITAADDKSYATRMMVDTTPAVAALLARIPARIPDLDANGEALFSARMGLNVPPLRDALTRLFDTLLEKGADCETLDQDAVLKGKQSLALLFGPGLSGIHGLAIAVDAVHSNPSTKRPTGVDAELLLAADDPRGLFGLLALVSPDLARLSVPDDGTPVALPLQNLAPMAPPTWIAIADHALALAIRATPPKQLSRVLQTPPANEPVFTEMRLRFDRLAREVAPLLDSAIARAPDEEAEALRDAAKQLELAAGLYRAIDFRIGADAQGIVMESKVSFE